MHQTLLDHGELHIADYGLQRTWLMRTLFRSVIQNLDGRTNTEPNARGVLPELMRAAGFSGRQGGIGHSHTQRLDLPVSRDPAVKITQTCGVIGELRFDRVKHPPCEKPSWRHLLGLSG